MNVTGSRDFAHHAASRIRDPLSRAGLAETFREMSALAAGAITGLAEAADNDGACVDSGVNAVLLMVRDMAAEAAEKVHAGDVFVSCREAEQRLRDRCARDDEFAADPYLMLRDSDLAHRTAAAYNAGAADRETAYA
jgi:hypothetical protein